MYGEWIHLTRRSPAGCSLLLLTTYSANKRENKKKRKKEKGREERGCSLSRKPVTTGAARTAVNTHVHAHAGGYLCRVGRKPYRDG